MPHSECTNAIQRALAILLERDRLTFADLLHRNQRYPGEHFGVLELIAEFLEAAHLGDDEPGLGRRVLQMSARHCRMAFRTESGLTPHLRTLSARAASLG